MTRAHFKFLAKRQLEGKVGSLFLAWLISFGIMFAAVGLIAAAAIVLGFVVEANVAVVVIVCAVLYLATMIIVNPALTLGRVMLIQKIAAQPDEPVKASYVLKGFRHFWGAFKVQFFSGLFFYLWCLLFYFPGIIKAFSYSQAMYIYAENPDMGALAAISRSKMMMRGRKFDFFTLIILSFYPWILLAPFTLGILYVWLIPYMELTAINFYNYAKRVPGHPDYGFPTVGEIIPPQAFAPVFVDEYERDLTAKEEPVAEEPVMEKPVVEEPVTEETVVEEEPAVEEEIAVEETVVDEPKAEEAPTIEEPVVEESEIKGE